MEDRSIMKRIRQRTYNSYNIPQRKYQLGSSHRQKILEKILQHFKQPSKLYRYLEREMN